METLWLDITQLALAKWVAGSIWAYPLLETAHVIGLGLLFGPIVLVDLRILGFARELPLAQFGRYLLTCVWVGFFINATSGILLFTSDAAEFAGNTAFRIKLLLIAFAGLNALLFHRGTFAETMAMRAGEKPSAKAIAAATLSIFLWVGVIAAGRLIAYVN